MKSLLAAVGHIRGRQRPKRIRSWRTCSPRVPSGWPPTTRTTAQLVSFTRVCSVFRAMRGKRTTN